MPFFTIVTPTFNRPHLLRRAVESVRAQTFPDWEMVVVSDGPVTANEAVVQGFKDPRLRYYAHTAHVGHPGAGRNLGLDVGGGRYVTYLDDDDWYEPTHLQSLYKLLREGRDEIIAARCMYAHHQLKTYTPSGIWERLWVKNLQILFAIFHPSRVVHRHMGPYSPRWPNPPGSEDWQFWIRLMDRGCRFRVTSRPTLNIFVDLNSTFNVSPAYYKYFFSLWCSKDPYASQGLLSQIYRKGSGQRLHEALAVDIAGMIEAARAAGELDHLPEEMFKACMSEWLDPTVVLTRMPILLGTRNLIPVYSGGSYHIGYPLAIHCPSHAARVLSVAERYYQQVRELLRKHVSVESGEAVGEAVGLKIFELTRSHALSDFNRHVAALYRKMAARQPLDSADWLCEP